MNTSILTIKKTLMVAATETVSFTADSVRQWPIGGGIFENFWMSFGNYNGTPYAHAVLFNNITILQGKTINYASAKYYSATNYSNDTCNVNFYFNAEDNPTMPISTGAAEALSLTSASPWNSIEHWTASVAYTSPNIKSIVQEIVNRPGWASGNSMLLVCRDNASSYSGYRAGNSTVGKTVLTITYTI